MRTQTILPPPPPPPPSTFDQLNTDLRRKLEVIEILEPKVPFLLQAMSNRSITLEQDLDWACERLSKKNQQDLKKHKLKAVFYRVMNHFTLLLDSPNDQNENTYSMVVPELQPKAEDGTDNVYFLIGLASPVLDGARRSARAIAGYTPLYAARSHPDLWQMSTKLVGAWVGTPYMGQIEFYGCRIPCIMFLSVDQPNVHYAVQTPDRYYKPYWEVTLASWRVDAELEDDVVPPKVWKDVDLVQPRPWWMPRWAMQVLRLEQGLPPDHPKDPARLAMLGGC
ncbi:hypothetical protein RhiTH_011258 [Rhizoctonia solani]